MQLKTILGLRGKTQGLRLRKNIASGRCSPRIEVIVKARSNSKPVCNRCGNRDLSIRLTDGEGGIANSLVRIAVT